MNEELYPKVYLYKRIVRAKLFIDNNFDRNIELDSMAGEACFSLYHFLRLFKKAYGQTPHQYLVSVRITHAKKLLEQGLPVSQICQYVGFESIGSFSALFKRITGCTPTAYQQQCREERTAVATKPLAYIPGCFAQANGWTGEQKQF